METHWWGRSPDPRNERGHTCGSRTMTSHNHRMSESGAQDSDLCSHKLRKKAMLVILEDSPWSWSISSGVAEIPTPRCRLCPSLRLSRLIRETKNSGNFLLRRAFSSLYFLLLSHELLAEMFLSSKQENRILKFFVCISARAQLTEFDWRKVFMESTCEEKSAFCQSWKSVWLSIGFRCVSTRSQ